MPDPSASSPSRLRRLFVGPRGWRAGWRILLFHLIFVGLSAAAFWVVLRIFGDLRRGAFTIGKLLAMEAIYLPCVIAAVATMARLERRRFADYGIPGRDLFGRNFWVGAAAGVALLGAVTVALVGAGAMRVRGLRLAALTPAGVATAFVAVLVAALFEEIFFRGYFLSALADGLGFWPAAVLQSLYFGFVLHYLEKENETFLDGFNVSLIGLFLCWTVLRSGDIAWATGIHFSFNFTSFFVLGSPNTAFGGPVEPHLLDSTFAGPQWLTGGATGLEASALTTLAFLLLFAVARRGFRHPPSVRLRSA